jgi:hypothetical protein
MTIIRAVRCFKFAAWAGPSSIVSHTLLNALSLIAFVHLQVPHIACWQGRDRSSPSAASSSENIAAHRPHLQTSPHTIRGNTRFIFDPNLLHSGSNIRHRLGIFRFQHSSIVSGRLSGKRESAVSLHRFLNRTDSQLPSELHPPSTVNVAPFTKPLSLSSARKAIARATSSGRANRPIGTLCVISASV